MWEANDIITNHNNIKHQDLRTSIKPSSPIHQSVNTSHFNISAHCLRENHSYLPCLIKNLSPSWIRILWLPLWRTSFLELPHIHQKCKPFGWQFRAPWPCEREPTKMVSFIGSTHLRFPSWLASQAGYSVPCGWEDRAAWLGMIWTWPAAFWPLLWSTTHPLILVSSCAIHL